MAFTLQGGRNQGNLMILTQNALSFILEGCAHETFQEFDTGFDVCCLFKFDIYIKFANECTHYTENAFNPGPDVDNGTPRGIQCSVR